MAKHQKYGIADRLTGVYLITNKLNGKQYVGASVRINNRISNHMNRDAKRYLHHPFYEDVRLYGSEGFSFEVLEICEKDKLLEREQFWYDVLKPEYNLVRPSECHFNSEATRQKVARITNTPEQIAKRKELYSTPKYVEQFKEIQRKRMKQVGMYKDGELIKIFESYSEAQRWLNEHTEFEGKNKVSKIRDVCLGNRPSAFGYTWRLMEV